MVTISIFIYFLIFVLTVLAVSYFCVFFMRNESLATLEQQKVSGSKSAVEEGGLNCVCVNQSLAMNCNWINAFGLEYNCI